MKELVVVTILLISIAGQSLGRRPLKDVPLKESFIPTEPDWKNPETLIDKDRELIVSHLNQQRTLLAERNNITNMAKLSWDNGLAAKVKALSSNCDEIKPQQGYRLVFCDLSLDGRIQNSMSADFFLSIPETFGEEIKRIGELKASLTLIEKNKDARTFSHMEFMYPPQTKIGCARHQCYGTAPTTSGAKKQYRVSYICLLGDVSEVNTDLIQFKGGMTGKTLLHPSSSVFSPASLVFPVLLAAIFVRLQI